MSDEDNNEAIVDVTLNDSDVEEEPIENEELADIDVETIPYLTKYEFPVVLSTRIMQIDRGSKVFINDPEKYGDSYGIALEEFKRDLIPFTIKRPINRHKGIYQDIKLSELSHPLKYKSK